MKSFKLFFLFIMLCSAATRSLSQGNTGFFAGGGIMYYNGDLSDKTNKVFTEAVFFNPYACIGATHWLAGHIEGSLSLIHGKVSGADSVSQEKNNKTRNL